MVGKTNLNRVEVLICKSSIDSNISHCEFFSLDNVLQNYDDMKKEVKNSNSNKILKYIQNSFVLLFDV